MLSAGYHRIVRLQRVGGAFRQEGIDNRKLQAARFVIREFLRPKKRRSDKRRSVEDVISRG